MGTKIKILFASHMGKGDDTLAFSLHAGGENQVMMTLWDHLRDSL